MTNVPPSMPDAVRQTIITAIAAHWKAFLVQGLILCGLGLLAIASPLVTTIAIDIFIGFLFLMGGVVRALSLMKARHVPGYWWSMFGAILAIVLGLVMIAKPADGVLTLTMLLIILFAIEGVSGILSAVVFRQYSSNWVWPLISGVMNLVLVAMILQGWPGTASWAIGLLAGINLLFMGASLIMLSVGVSKQH